MNPTPETPRGAAALPPDVADRNVERLLDKAYKPEMPDPEFIQQTHARLQAVAEDAPRGRAVAGSTGPSCPRTVARRLACVLAAAAIFAPLAVGLHLAGQREKPPADDGTNTTQVPGHAAP